jgi:hypothetical protein
MKLLAIILETGANGAQTFTPDDDSWTLQIEGHRGSGPGGRWSTEDVVDHVVEALHDTVAPEWRAA